MKYTKSLIMSICLGLITLNGYATASAQQQNQALWDKLTEQANTDWKNTDNITQNDIKLLQKLAKKGDGNASYALGMVKLSRNNQNAALYWLDQAQAKGHAPATLMYQALMSQQNSTKYTQ